MIKENGIDFIELTKEQIMKMYDVSSYITLKPSDDGCARIKIGQVYIKIIKDEGFNW